jgi:hypothetical protein
MVLIVYYMILYRILLCRRVNCTTFTALHTFVHTTHSHTCMETYMHACTHTHHTCLYISTRVAIRYNVTRNLFPKKQFSCHCTFVHGIIHIELVSRVTSNNYLHHAKSNLCCHLCLEFAHFVRYVLYIIPG